MALVPIKIYAEKNPYTLSYYMLREIAESPHGKHLFRRISERHTYVDTEALDKWISKSSYFTSTRRKDALTQEKVDKLQENLKNAREKKKKALIQKMKETLTVLEQPEESPSGGRITESSKKQPEGL